LSHPACLEQIAIEFAKGKQPPGALASPGSKSQLYRCHLLARTKGPPFPPHPCFCSRTQQKSCCHLLARTERENRSRNIPHVKAATNPVKFPTSHHKKEALTSPVVVGKSPSRKQSHGSRVEKKARGRETSLTTFTAHLLSARSLNSHDRTVFGRLKLARKRKKFRSQQLAEISSFMLEKKNPHETPLNSPEEAALRPSPAQPHTTRLRKRTDTTTNTNQQLTLTKKTFDQTKRERRGETRTQARRRARCAADLPLL